MTTFSRKQISQAGILSLCSAILSSKNSFATNITPKDVEIIDAKPLDLPGDWQGFLEGPSKGVGNTLYFTNGIAEKNWGGISQVDITKPELGVKNVYNHRIGSMFLRNNKIFYTGTNPKTGNQAIGCFHNIDKKAFSELEILVESNVGDHQLSKVNDLVVGRDETVYFTDWKGKAVCRLSSDKKAKVIAKMKGNDLKEDLNNPNGIILSHDEKRVYVTDNSNILFGKLNSNGDLEGDLKHLLEGYGYSEEKFFDILEMGKATQKKKGEVTVGKYSRNINIDGMTVDNEGTIYGAVIGSGCVVGVDGVTGKLKRIVRTPESVTNCTIAGENNDIMCAVGKAGVSVAKLPVTWGL